MSKVITKRRERGSRSSLPYHAKKNTGSLVLMTTKSPCTHSLATHMDTKGKNGRPVTMSWAQQCTRKTKNHKTHKDSTGRVWA
jgi:hypothetical protein